MKLTFSISVSDPAEEHEIQRYIDGPKHERIAEEWFSEIRRILKYDDSDEAEALKPGLEKAREIMIALRHDYLSSD